MYYNSQGYNAEALQTSRRAVDILTRRGANSDPEPRTKRDYFLKHVLLLDTAATLQAIGRGRDSREVTADYSESFRAAQFAVASSAAQALAGMAARFAAGGDALAGVVRERQDLSGQGLCCWTRRSLRR